MYILRRFVDAISSSHTLQTDMSLADVLSGLASLTAACKLLIWMAVGSSCFVKASDGVMGGGERIEFVETAREGMWKQGRE
jgi:hypothetical protein